MANDTNSRIRRNAKRLIGELGTTQAAVARRAQAAGHTIDAPYLNHILQGRAPALGKVDAIADGLGVDAALLIMPAPD